MTPSYVWASPLSVAAALAVGGSLLAGCGGAPPPTDQLATTQAAIRAADENQAAEDPKAQLHLKLAREQLAEAKQLIEEEENERALNLLLRAEADAELARSLARQQKTREDADDAMKALEKLRENKKP